MTKMTEEQEGRLPQVYELGFHLTPTLSGEALSAVVLRMKEVLASHNASVIAEEEPHLIDLAYRLDKRIKGTIEKFSSANFGWLKFEASPADAKDIHKTIDSDASVIRSLLVKTVRENTLAPRRFAPTREEGSRTEKDEEVSVAAPAAVSDDELNRSIEELVK